jgi:hypothetical protein
VVVLPTPPFWFETARMRAMRVFRGFGGGKRAEARGIARGAQRREMARV